jgi:hypothetical protein
MCIINIRYLTCVSAQTCTDLRGRLCASLRAQWMSCWQTQFFPLPTWKRKTGTKLGLLQSKEQRYGFRVEAFSPDFLRWQAAYDERQRKHKLLWDKCVPAELDRSSKLICSRYLEENGGIPRIRDARLNELIRGGMRLSSLKGQA